MIARSMSVFIIFRQLDKKDKLTTKVSNVLLRTPVANVQGHNGLVKICGRVDLKQVSCVASEQAGRGCGGDAPGNELTGRRGVDCDALAVEVRAAVLPPNKALVGHDVECDTQHGLLFVAQPDGDGNLHVVGRGGCCGTSISRFLVVCSSAESKRGATR